MLGAPTPILRSFDEPRAPLYMGVALGGCTLHLSEHYGDGSPGAPLRIPVDDVAAYATALRAKEFGSARPGEPQETPWGTREVTAADRASNRLTFYSELVRG